MRDRRIDALRFARHPVAMSKLPFLMIAVSCVALTACQSAPATTANDSQMPQNPVPAVEQSPIDEDNSRLSALESRVGGLESRMDAADPTLEKVEAMETHFKALSFELDQISETYKLKKPAAPAPVAVAPKPAEKPVAKAIPKPEPKPAVKSDIKKESAPAAPAVTSVRIGEQKGEITRIVLDTTKPAELHYDLDNTENILVVDLPKNDWQATKSMTLKKSPMVKSFTGSSDESGAHLVLQLKQSAKVATTARLSPSGSYGNRVYIDLVPAK